MCPWETQMPQLPVNIKQYIRNIQLLISVYSMSITNIVSISLPVDRFANVLVYPKVYKSQITRFCFLALTLTISIQC
jgi:hypothetical protein